MYPGAEELYREIGNLVVGVAPDGWTEVVAVYQFCPDTDSEELFLRHRCPDVINGSTNTGSSTLPLFSAFERLRLLMARSDEKPWLTARFALRRDGDFSIDFDYEDELRWDENPTKRIIRDEFRRTER
jgi:hypothetical protein